MTQIDSEMSLEEAKTHIKASLKARWNNSHQPYNKEDPYHNLDRESQTLIFRLRTGHNRLRKHMFTKLKVGETPNCQCGHGEQTSEHILQTCPNFSDLRSSFWPQVTPLIQKLNGTLEDLTMTAEFARATCLQI